MSHTIRIIIGLLLLSAMLACNAVSSILPKPLPSPVPTAPAQNLPALTGDWRITFSQSGGIMGMSQELVLTSDGAMTITDVRKSESITIQAEPGWLDKLTALVSDTRYYPVALESGCADCFIFSIAIENGQETFQAQLNQIDLPASGLESLAEYLAQQLQANTQ